MGTAACATGDTGTATSPPTTAPPPPATAITSATTTTVATTTTTTTLPPLLGLALEVVAADLRRPTYVTAPPNDDRLFIVQREGTVLVLDPARNLPPEPFLDLSDQVGSGGIEQGLLGMAFHPRYAENGRLFVYFTDPSNDTRLVEITVTGERADPTEGRELLHVREPTDRHNGGMLLFGPDGYLYLGLGEGGAARDNAQHPETLLGTILRLDVDGGDPYAIPPDNPFVGGGGAPEVWAYGLRNPWRFAIDPAERLVYIADVGHSEWEEIDVVPLDGGGYNFGWLPMEGSHCFLRNCDPTGMVLPVLEYGHSEGCSVTGGFVYRGEAIPELAGHYFYGDWCRGWVRSFRYDGAVTEQRDWTDDLGTVGQINSFGLDAAGELYLATWEGTVARIVPVR